jgi:hypothetical protein
MCLEAVSKSISEASGCPVLPRAIHRAIATGSSTLPQFLDECKGYAENIHVNNLWVDPE